MTDRSEAVPAGGTLVKAAVSLALAVLVIAVFGQTVTFDFVNYDDQIHIADNPIVSGGMNFTSIVWAFDSVYAANWVPLTWISHMLDVQLFGMNAGMHHLTNVAIHAANSVLLFLLLGAMTGSVWRPAFAAVLFAIHPLHVESVAWVSERKDVLSGLFWILTMLAYVRYARRRNLARYLSVAILFGLGLMAKPTLVTLPFVLLLVDFWPLARIAPPAGMPSGPGMHASWGGWSGARALVTEKVPLFLLSLASCGVTVYAQRAFGAMSTLQDIPLAKRLGNALCSYVLYLWKAVVPVDLAAFYPYPEAWSPAFTAACGLFLAAATALALLRAARSGYLAMGWLWFLGTLVPMIGIVQVGSQAMADRYTYIPLIGIFILVSWGGHELLNRWKHGRVVATVLCATAVVALSCLAWKQTGHWKDSVSLFTHALEATENNYLAHNNLGKALFDRGQTGEALARFEEALRINPAYEMAHDNLAGVLVTRKDYDGALAHYRESLRLNPDAAKSHYNLGYVLGLKGDTAGAAEEYRNALRIDPGYANAHNNLGLILESSGRAVEAEGHFVSAVKASPGLLKARMNLVSLYRKQGRLREALALVDGALERDPGSATLTCLQAGIYADMGSVEKARAAYEKALSLRPGMPSAVHGLVTLYTREGSYGKAAELLRGLLAANPDDPGACYNLACLYALQNDRENAVRWLALAVQKGFDDWNLLRSDKDLYNIRDTALYRKLLEKR